MMEGSVDELRGLIEDYIVALELGQHQDVSDKGVTIHKRLVELLDQDILETDADSGRTNLLLSEKLNVLCRKLKHQSKLAATYRDVVEFVRVRVGNKKIEKWISVRTMIILPIKTPN